MVVTPVAMLAILIASIVLMSQGKASYYAWNQDKVCENLYLITLEVIFAFSYSLDLSQIVQFGFKNGWLGPLSALQALWRSSSLIHCSNSFLCSLLTFVIIPLYVMLFYVFFH